MIGKSRIDDPACAQHHAVRLRTRQKLVHRSAAEQDQVRAAPDPDHAMVIQAHDGRRCRRCGARPIAVWRIEVRDTHRLGEDLVHVQIAVTEERIDRVVARDGDLDAARPHLVKQRHAAPAWSAADLAILKVLIAHGQTDDRDAGVGTQVQRRLDVRFGLNR